MCHIVVLETVRSIIARRHSALRGPLKDRHISSRFLEIIKRKAFESVLNLLQGLSIIIVICILRGFDIALCVAELYTVIGIRGINRIFDHHESRVVKQTNHLQVVCLARCPLEDHISLATCSITIALNDDITEGKPSDIGRVGVEVLIVLTNQSADIFFTDNSCGADDVFKLRVFGDRARPHVNASCDSADTCTGSGSRSKLSAFDSGLAVNKYRLSIVAVCISHRSADIVSADDITVLNDPAVVTSERSIVAVVGRCTSGDSADKVRSRSKDVAVLCDKATCAGSISHYSADIIEFRSRKRIVDRLVVVRYEHPVCIVMRLYGSAYRTEFGRCGKRNTQSLSYLALTAVVPLLRAKRITLICSHTPGRFIPEG